MTYHFQWHRRWPGGQVKRKAELLVLGWAKHKEPLGLTTAASEAGWVEPDLEKMS